jgi:uncharacterized membrane protein
MDTTALFWTAILAVVPISELRGAIPFGLAAGLDWRFVVPYVLALNALVGPIAWVFLNTVHGFLYKLSWYKKLFDQSVASARSKLEKGVERWGWLGIAIFIGIPLPFTGAWTGVLGAWVFGLSARKTMLAVVLGVLMAGAIVSAVCLFGLTAFDFFVKRA